MVTFAETASGGVGVGGLAVLTTTRVVGPTKFKERNAAFIKKDAEQKGKISIIYIKKVICHQVYKACPQDFPGVQFITIYIDTYNAVYFEEELATNQEALDLAIAYWEAQLIPAS